MSKTIKEINEKIKKGAAVVVTAEEMIDIVKASGRKKAAERVDVVTTGTFAPMCSSGVFLNFGHTKPKIKMQKVWLNEIEACAGLAAVDVYLGATQMPWNDPLNEVHPGKFTYGGGHLIEDLVAGKSVRLKAVSYGTDCYPRKEAEASIRLSDINEAVMCNPRNVYQNYNCAVNLSGKTLYTYMGTLKPELGNANYCSAGQLSPLLNDPEYRTIGMGTRIFLGGARGYVVWNGTQHSPCAPRNSKGVPEVPAGTLMVMGDLKEMTQYWVRGASMAGYGATLILGIGIPIPVLDESIAENCGVSDADISCPIVDYSDDYPNATGKVLGSVSYSELKKGSIEIRGKTVPTASLSSYSRALEIANLLKEWITRGEFLIGEPQRPTPGTDSGIKFKSLKTK
ncbi:MAG: homocysteine biosynthesis protein [Elusimicrobia bacterium]|nr:homocysteine biosynthesis protein [Elusimicrobiota bacterium]